MPIRRARYRWKTNPDGTKVRLAFVDGKVVEVKKKGGKAHRVKPRRRKAKRKR